MAPINEWPDGLFSALVAAAVSVVGFGLKELYDRHRKQQQEQRLAQQAAAESQQQAVRTLTEFSHLLADSDAIASSHFQLRDRLIKTLPEARLPHETYNDWLARLHAAFSPQQLEMFQLLRSTTANSMRIQNQLLLDWANRHSAFTLFGPGLEEQAFDEELGKLRAHLRGWRDKFQSGFETNPRQSLVYLADENKLGTGFPQQLSGATEVLVAKHKGRAVI